MTADKLPSLALMPHVLSCPFRGDGQVCTCAGPAFVRFAAYLAKRCREEIAKPTKTATVYGLLGELSDDAKKLLSRLKH